MAKNQMSELFTAVQIERPSLKIVKQIRHLISIGALQKGDRLPSERELCERFAVGRGYVREAIKELEFCGILSTSPQSGTIVANTGMQVMGGLITNMLEFEEYEWKDLLEVRAVLETNAVWLAATRINKEQKEELMHLHQAFVDKVMNGDSAIEEDMQFHLKIAEFSGNSIIRLLIGTISPDILSISRARNSCSDDRVAVTLKEHKKILDCLMNNDPEGASRAMQTHMDEASVSIITSITNTHVDSK